MNKARRDEEFRYMCRDAGVDLVSVKTALLLSILMEKAYQLGLKQGYDASIRETQKVVAFDEFRAY
jgi:hypothetical protein